MADATVAAGAHPLFRGTDHKLGNSCAVCHGERTSGCWRQGWTLASGARVNLCNRSGAELTPSFCHTCRLEDVSETRNCRHVSNLQRLEGPSHAMPTHSVAIQLHAFGPKHEARRRMTRLHFSGACGFHFDWRQLMSLVSPYCQMCRCGLKWKKTGKPQYGIDSVPPPSSSLRHKKRPNIDQPFALRHNVDKAPTNMHSQEDHEPLSIYPADAPPAASTE